MQIAFTLTMPGRNSWNGRWSGEDKLWAIVRRYKDAKAVEILSKGSYYYSFGDGWAANVDVRNVEKNEACRIRRKSAGFAGYDWMVDSIERHGEILNSLQEEQRRKAVATP